MGNTSIAENGEEVNSTIKLSIDLKKDINPAVKQLINWSIGDIRQIYSSYRRRKNTSLLNRTDFSRLVGFSRTTAFYLFGILANKDNLSVFEVICLMVLTSYSRMGNKLHFLFLVFDLTSRGSLVLSEMLLMYKSMIKGYCKLTCQKCPENAELDKFAKFIFTKSDLNSEQGMEVNEVVEMFESNINAIQLFKRFDSKQVIKEDYSVYNKFTAYSEDEANQIKEMVQSRSNGFHRLQPITRQISKSPTEILNKINKVERSEEKTCVKVSILMSKDMNGSDFFGSKHKQQKMMIVKGLSITKKQIFKLKQYFDALANGHNSISMSQFSQAFRSQRYDHMRSITASLFNFLDRKQTGLVTFEDLVKKLYPGLKPSNYATIMRWMDEYQKIYDPDKKRTTEKKEDNKKRTLPKNCLIRLREIFELFDKQKKGWVGIEDLVRQFGNAYSEKEINQMFETRDKDKDGKLIFQEFIRILLPSDIQIEGMKTTQ